MCIGKRIWVGFYITVVRLVLIVDSFSPLILQSSRTDVVSECFQLIVVTVYTCKYFAYTRNPTPAWFYWCLWCGAYQGPYSLLHLLHLEIGDNCWHGFWVVGCWYEQNSENYFNCMNLPIVVNSQMWPLINALVWFE